MSEKLFGNAGIRRRLCLALALAGMALSLLGGAACAQGGLEQILAAGTVRVGIAGEQPYAYRNQTGEVTGEAAEIARVVLARIAPDTEIEWVQNEFGQLIPNLRNGNIDLIAAGMFITPERCKLVSFSEPTYVVGEALAVKAGNPKRLASFLTISDHADARVGLISGTVEYNYALVTGIPAERALLYSDFPEAIEALEAGEVDAVAMTALTARNIVADRPTLESSPQFFPLLDGVEVKGYGGFAFRREDVALHDAFQAALGGFLGSEAHRELVAPFGFTSDMAADSDTATLCAG